MMLLKLNKEGPFKKEVFRAPGQQASMKKLIHFLQQVSRSESQLELNLTLFIAGPSRQHPELLPQHHRQCYEEVPQEDSGWYLWP